MNKIKLSSDRLKLRLISFSDLEAIHNLHSVPAVDAFNTLGIPENLDQTKAVLNGWLAEAAEPKILNYIFGIEHISKNDFIGLIALKLGKPKFKTGEVWYKLLPEFWGQGLATEAFDAVLEFGFDTLQLHRIEAGCAVENIGSVKVLEKVGMLREGRKRKVLPLKTGWSDNFIYAILEEDYFKKKEKDIVSWPLF